MKSILSAAAACLIVAGATLTAQAQQQQQQQQQQEQKAPPEVTLSGCLLQGSNSTTFILDNAKMGTGTTTEQGVKYLVVADNQGIDLRSHVNQQVQITGPTDGKQPPPPEKTIPETELPTVRAKSISSLSNVCT